MPALPRALCRLAALLLASTLAGGVWAQSAKPVRILVGFPPGGGTDAIARVLADKLREPLGTQVIVDNRGGAGGQIAAQTLKAAPADGSTFFISHDHTISILPLTLKNPGFDPAQDFVPVAGIASFVNVLALSPGTPAKGFKEWADKTRASKGQAAVGVPAPASVPEFLVKVINQKYGLDLVSAPYRGTGPMLNDMLGNQIPAGIGSVPEFLENHKAGKVRVVAVLGGKRQPALPEVPTFAELGLSGFEDEAFYGFWAPAGTPRAEVDRFAEAVAKALAQPEVQQRLGAMGLKVQFMNGSQLAAREHAYSLTWAQIIKASGFQPQ